MRRGKFPLRFSLAYSLLYKNCCNEHAFGVYFFFWFFHQIFLRNLTATRYEVEDAEREAQLILPRRNSVHRGDSCADNGILRRVKHRSGDIYI